MPVRAGRKGLAVPALKVQNRLIYASIATETPPWRAKIPERLSGNFSPFQGSSESVQPGRRIGDSNE